ncbi:107-domain-containing protein [Cunninghamella echinulata]|nr:107-domain-containing protein [Cunninghamella echinulata]
MLLDTIQRSTDPINTCSNIKQWISGISNYNQMDIITKKKFEEEIDDEMFSIFNNIPSLFNPFKDNGQSRKRKNVMDKEDNEMKNNDSFDDTLPIHYDNETMPKVIRRRLEDQDNNDDHFYELQYIRLRNGDMDDFIQHNQFDKLPWRKALFTSYVQRYNKFQLNQNNFLEIDEQKSWQLSCKGLIHQSGLEKYGEALYGVLIGDIQHQLQVCQSWEDIIWAYYNSQIEYGLNEIANKLALSEDLSTLNNKYKEIADQKDNNLPSQHVNHFFHLIQSHILNKQLHSLFELIYLHMTDKKSLKAMDIMNDVGIHKHMHRFMATLAIYANMYFSLPKENTNSGWLIYTYAEQYQNPAIFNPTLLAIYAAKLNEDNQVELFSNFLNGFDGEKEERKILIDMGKEHHLQMKSILRSTFKKHTKEPLKEIEAMGKNSIDNSIIEEANIPSCVSSYLHGLEWLMMDEALYGDVLNEANYILRQLFGLQRINLVAVVIKFIPTDILNVCILNTNEVLGIPPYLEEFRDHCTLVDCLDLYRSWQTLHNNYPSATL